MSLHAAIALPHCPAATHPRLMLAPMEGLADHLMRELLTTLSPFERAVTEFARVSGTVLPPRYFLRMAPELARASRTSAGVPVRVQLLGSDPARMAATAVSLAALAPAGIDLNFGCPAPTVNRHRGGAALLDEPELLYAIADAVRAALPQALPLSAKMRLGVRDPGRALECAHALAEGGVAELVVHARTKAEGYRPPAHWAWVGRISDAVSIPVVANGEVWCLDDWRRCRAESGVTDVMLGRGAVADPFLVRHILAGQGPDVDDPRDADWRELAPVLWRYWQGVRAKVAPRHAAGRVKQWLNLLRRTFLQAAELFAAIRETNHPVDVERILLAALCPAGFVPQAAGMP